MGMIVTMGAMMTCDMGTAPMPLVVEPEGALVTAGAPVATIADCIPMVNSPSFAVCHSPSNPACYNPAAEGPCVPVTAPWVPGAPTVLVNGIPALTDDSMCQCALGGTIMITEPGQFVVEVAG